MNQVNRLLCIINLYWLYDVLLLTENIVKMSKNSAETTPSSLTPVKVKSFIGVSLESIRKLSRPKIKIGNDEEMVGPGSYEVRNGFLFTKSKSPSAAIGRSERFLKVKIKEIKKSVKKL